MAWEQRPLEKFLESLLTKKLGSHGDVLWNRYEVLRNELVAEVLPWIASQETGLTDHGPTHIADVIDNAALLLGFNNHFDDAPNWQESEHFSPQEMYVLVCGLLMHDVGNILGRSQHNEKIGQVWTKLASWKTWSAQERQVVISVGRAHSGKGSEGGLDTLKDLAVSPAYFEKSPINAAQIAATIRFADELAEGPQRTSHFMLQADLMEQGSKLFHQYAEVTRVSISRANKRVALTYSINTDNSSYPTDKPELHAHLCRLLKMIYVRCAKMNNERQLCRHYADVLLPFRNTSIGISFYRDGSRIDLSLPTIELNDITDNDHSSDLIAKRKPEFDITSLISKVLEQ